VVGALSAAQARQLAASHHGTSPAMALILDGAHWAQSAAGRSAADGEPRPPAFDILTAAGWRVVLVTSATPLADAWRELHNPVVSGFLRRPVSTEAPAITTRRLEDLAPTEETS
jgi:hypothetical protein